MEIKKHKDINNYEKIQIERSRQKFDFCKVSYNDVSRWQKIIKEDLKKNHLNFRICCLGTRSGKEVDLFRIGFSNNLFLKLIMRMFSISKILEKFLQLIVYPINRKKISFDKMDYAYGVEINPDAKRKDILIANFDLLPKDWDNKFNVIFSNSFDQSMNPIKTSEQWKTLAENKSTYFIICFSYTEPTLTDPVGYITFEDIKSLFPGKVIYCSKNISTYHEIIIKN